MFGVAMGGVVLHIIVAMRMRRGRNEPFRVEPILLISTFTLGIVLPLAWYLLNRLQLDPYRIFLELSHFLNFVALFFLLSLPFLLASLTIGIFFFFAKSHVGKVYAFDLAGAGLGALLPTLLIATLTPSGVIKMLTVLGLIASILVAVSAKSPRPIKTALITLALQFIVTVWAFLSSDFGLIYVMPFKSIVKYHKAEELKYTRWSAIGRIDLYDIPEQNSWGIEYDGGMGHSQILRLDGDLTKVDPYNDKFNGRGFGYFDVFFGLRQNADFLALGIGGGMEVIAMLRHQPRHVDALEINPILIGYLNNELAEETHHVFNQPPINLILDEARSFVARTNKRYDFITLFSILTESAYAGGAAALLENYVETKEAYVDYLNHLKPGGFLIVRTYNERIIPTLAAALRQIGQTDYARNLAVVGRYIALGRHAISPADLAAIRAQAHKQEIEKSVYWLPDDHKSAYPRYAPLLTGNLDEYVKRQTENFSVATDDFPFFNEAGKWQNFTWKGLRKFGIGVTPRMHFSGAFALVVLGMAGFLGLTFLVIPVWVVNRILPKKPATRISASSYYASFFLVGIGYIFAEVLSISRLSLFIGHPAYAFATVLGGMLIGSGMAGYYLDSRMEQAVLHFHIKIVLAAAIFFSIAMIGPKLHTLLPVQQVAIRIAIGGLGAGVVGFALGQIFPLLLFRLTRESLGLLPLCWGLNGYGSLIGAPLAMLALTAGGFNFSSMSVVVIYGFVLLLVISRRNNQVGSGLNTQGEKLQSNF